jgi:ComF family protein
MIRQYKLSRRQGLDAVLGGLLADRIEGVSWRPEVEALVPVPSHWTRRWRRGFSPTGALAVAVARRLGMGCSPVLERPSRGRSQIGLNATERRTNVRNAFQLMRGANVAGRRVCLVDDVMVTGATLRENVRALKRAGASAVYVAVLAKVDPTDAQMADV